MKITGIIAEYNPFHNGHLYQIEQVKKNGADYVVIVMSGDFLQRGTPAILDKWTRTHMALLNGADLVIELPCVFATASAQYFARGGVSLLDKLGAVDTLSFGCESDDTNTIHTISTLLCEEPISYKETLQAFLKEGNSFPKAREMAISSVLGKEAASFVSSPNNILALEYCIALSERNSKIKLLPVKREGNGYHAAELEQDLLPSATAIRRVLEAASDSRNQLNSFVPESVFSILNENTSDFIWQNDFSLLLHYKLLSIRDFSINQFADVSKDLSDKISKNLRFYQNYEQFCGLLKSKELTYSRINRALTHILLDITQNMYEDVKANDYASYARILGFRKDAAPLLSEIGKFSSIPLISKLADAGSILSERDYRYLEHDIFCAHVYDSVVATKTDSAVKNEFQQQLVIL